MEKCCTWIIRTHPAAVTLTHIFAIAALQGYFSSSDFYLEITFPVAVILDPSWRLSISS